MKLSIEDLKQVLNYDPETGWFTWKIETYGHGRKICPGDRAGTIGEGRRQVGYQGRVYRESRLAWVFMTNEWPPKGMDVEHENENGEDNRWKNLRLASRSQNVHNRVRPRSDNKSGQTGVHWRKGRKLGTGKWHARIKVEGKGIVLLGDFESKNEAIRVRREAEKRFLGGFAPNRMEKVA